MCLGHIIRPRYWAQTHHRIEVTAWSLADVSSIGLSEDSANSAACYQHCEGESKAAECCLNSMTWLLFFTELEVPQTRALIAFLKVEYFNDGGIPFRQLKKDRLNVTKSFFINYYSCVSLLIQTTTHYCIWKIHHPVAGKPWCKNISHPPLILHPNPECCPQRPASSLNLSHISTIINMNGCSTGRVPAFMASRLLLWSQLKLIKRSRWSREFTQVSKVTSLGFYLSLTHMLFHSHTSIFLFLATSKALGVQDLSCALQRPASLISLKQILPKDKRRKEYNPSNVGSTQPAFVIFSGRHD